MTIFDQLEAALSPAGMILRGGFHPAPDDHVPDLPDGRVTNTVVLAGNAGPAMWNQFAADSGQQDDANPLEDWMHPRIRAAAQAVGAHPIFPTAGPPFVPIQDWGRRAEPIHRSPVGIMIHPVYGLWHVYRAAFCFAERLDLPARPETPSPCESCAAKPCLTVCPVDAFKPTRFDVDSCAPHVADDAGAACRERGCMARRACPVGRDHVYPRDAQAFHMRAFLRLVRRGYGRRPTDEQTG